MEEAERLLFMLSINTIIESIWIVSNMSIEGLASKRFAVKTLFLWKYSKRYDSLTI